MASDERPDDDLKAWAEWNRKPGDERPDVQQAVDAYIGARFRAETESMRQAQGDDNADIVGCARGERDQKFRALITAVRADLEAENRRLREALEKALDIAEEWIYGELSGTSLLDGEMAKLEPCRQALAAADTGRPERS